mmetsp:Transcript_11692/g.16852  ORF Transcript_11692/g.16852 Transcript_11692/m.16852 type:complete len:626 (+) Transcript_11692:226-2103(+)
MRKAAPKHRTRRKASLSNSSSSGGLTAPLSGCFDEDFDSGDAVGFGYNMNEQIIENAGDTRKEPINDADEKALITKNYRLAKELSDLKTKHREEAKAVTRLTMENMNLAAHMREAMGQIASLKRELIVRQKKIVLLQQQVDLAAGNLSAPAERMTQVFNKDEQQPSQLPEIVQKFPEPPAKETDGSSEVRVSEAGFEKSIPGPPPPVPVRENKINKTHSPPPTPEAKNEVKTPSPPSFDKTEEINTNTFFSERLSKESNTTSKLFPYDPFDSSSPLQTQKTLPEATSSSSRRFDAFDSAFDAHFPVSFGTPKQKPPPMTVSFDAQVFPDPFFPAAVLFDNSIHQKHSFDTQRRVDSEVERSQKAQDVSVTASQIRIIPPPPHNSPPFENKRLSKSDFLAIPSKRIGSEAPRGQAEKKTAPEPQGKPKHTGLETSNRPISIGSTSIVAASNNSTSHHVPQKSHSNKASGEQAGGSSSLENNWKGDALLRDISLKGGNNGEHITFGQEKSNTKAGLIHNSLNAKENQPIQTQSKIKGSKTSRNSLEGPLTYSAALPAMISPTNSEKIAAAMDLEIRRLDSLLASSSYPTRRSTSSNKPISYAEPSTKSKLRRGDKFFPKSDLMTTLD